MSNQFFTIRKYANTFNLEIKYRHTDSKTNNHNSVKRFFFPNGCNVEYTPKAMIKLLTEMYGEII